ncbi:MAG: PRTRC genetic system protein B [Colwellia sp.]|jgi:PRTRC genetic system protein B
MDFDIENFTHIQSAQTITPVQALVTYQNSNILGEQEFIMARHDFDKNIKGEYVLGDAKLLSISQQHKIAYTMLDNKNTTTGSNLIDENVLAIYPDGLAWFIKAKIWKMRFSIGGRTKVYSIPMPPHVVKIRGRTISLYAIKKNTRPTKNTKLFISPVPNVYDSNRLCTGSVDFPKTPNQDDMIEIEQGIFTTINTHSHVQSLLGIKAVRHVQHLISLDKQSHFSIQKLIPLPSTLKDVI